ncbi:MAG: hypothetical protein HQK92_02865 [Nitrospirae bacterium]|nr:hypothetical protein [Nitrospirota bacterium]
MAALLKKKDRRGLDKKSEVFGKSINKIRNDYAKAWLNITLLSGDDIDVNGLVKGVQWLYKINGLNIDKEDIHIADDPLKANELASILVRKNKDKNRKSAMWYEDFKQKNNIYKFECDSLVQDVGWVSHAQIFIDSNLIPGKLAGDIKSIISYLTTGPFMALFLDDFAIVIRRPKVVKLKPNNNDFIIHADEDYAVEWRGGYKMYFLNGVPVPKEIALTPAHKLNATLVLKENNATVRREVLRKVGAEKFLKDLKGKKIDTYQMTTEKEELIYELYNIELPGMMDPIKALKMRNPSIGVYHVECVTPEIRTVKQALAWRNGMDVYTDPIKIT